MGTRGSGIYKCTLEQANFVAECAGLRLESKPYLRGDRYPSFVANFPGACDSGYGENGFYFWQDRQTGGGGARIVWTKGYAWVSSHYGYAWADITQEVNDLFEELPGVVPMDDAYSSTNPLIYGMSEFEDRWQSTEHFLARKLQIT